MRRNRGHVIQEMLHGIERGKSTTTTKIITLMITASYLIAEHYAGTGFRAGATFRTGEHNTSPQSD